MKIFTRWTIIMAATAVGCYFAGKAGAFTGLLKYDSSYLGFVIIALATGAACFMGKISRDIDNWNERTQRNNDLSRRQFSGSGRPLTDGEVHKLKKEFLLKEVGFVRFVAEVCFDLGLLSTIIGLVLMFLGMGSDITSVIGAIKNGLSTAFMPTLVGMVASLVLRVQMFVAEYSMKD
jgi:ABC-type uncharacterized transport system permease subunit